MDLNNSQKKSTILDVRVILWMRVRLSSVGCWGLFVMSPVLPNARRISEVEPECLVQSFSNLWRGKIPETIRKTTDNYSWNNEYINHINHLDLNKAEGVMGETPPPLHRNYILIFLKLELVRVYSKMKFKTNWIHKICEIKTYLKNIAYNAFSTIHVLANHV